MYMNRDGVKVNNKEFIKMPREEANLEIYYRIIVFKEKEDDMDSITGVERFGYKSPTKEQIIYSILKHNGDYAEISTIHKLEYEG